MNVLSPVSAQPRFSPHERQLLLAERGIGQRVVGRLEQLGLHSLEQLRQLGVPQVVLMVCSDVGSIAWANRRKPLERAVARSLERDTVEAA